MGIQPVTRASHAWLPQRFTFYFLPHHKITHTYSRKKNERNMKTEERSRRHKPKESRIISLSETNTVVSWGCFLFIFNFLICLCFACMHVYKPHMLLVPLEAKRGLWIPCEQVLDRREPSVGAGNQP